MENKNISTINLLGLSGSLFWSMSIFLRGSDIAENEVINFLLGIAPNFGVGLMLPMFIIVYYPTIFKKEIVFNKLILILILSYIVLFVSEVIHDKFLNSRFDIYDMIASFIAFVIMVLAYKYKKVKNKV